MTLTLSVRAVCSLAGTQTEAPTHRWHPSLPPTPVPGLPDPSCSLFAHRRHRSRAARCILLAALVGEFDILPYAKLRPTFTLRVQPGTQYNVPYLVPAVPSGGHRAIQPQAPCFSPIVFLLSPSYLHSPTKSTKSTKYTLHYLGYDRTYSYFVTPNPPTSGYTSHALSNFLQPLPPNARRFTRFRL